MKYSVGDRPSDSEINGGLKPETAPQVVAAGVNVLVAGSAVFKGGSEQDYRANIAAICAACDDAITEYQKKRPMETSR